MLASWLEGPLYQAFVNSRVQRAPFAQPSAFRGEDARFDWDVLDRVLGAEPAPDVLVVRQSELLREPAPRTAREVRALFAREAGIVVRRAERHEPSLAALAHAFERDLGGSAHLQLFVTPGGTQGFGWHYDEEDVCILQTVGSKTYYFRANTQVGDDEEGAPDFTRVKRETSPLMTCTLAAHDLLYLPRRMWHAAKALEDSLSISVGVR